jgi:ParB-like chromosome segregation protein Spo0J
MGRSAPFQVLQALRPEEYSALKADILQRGVLVPVEIDAESGAIIDGHHRARIAHELGLKYRTIRRRFDSDAERIQHALKLNLLRRNLGEGSSEQTSTRRG